MKASVEKSAQIVEGLLSDWTGFVCRFPIAVIAVTLLVAALAGLYSARNLAINTDDSEMLSADLDFEQHANAFNRAYPQLKDPIIIVVRAPTGEEAEGFSAVLVERLAARRQTVKTVFAPKIDPFFMRNGLLYIGTSELKARMSDLAGAAPMLEALRRTPTLEALLAMLADTAGQVEQGSDLGAMFDRIYAALSRIVRSGLAEERHPLSWRELFAESDGPAMVVITVRPVLDYGSLTPAEKTLDVIDEEIERLRPTFAGRVRVGITGPPALRADELESVVSGIGLSFAISFVLVAVLLLSAFRSLILALVTLLSLIVTLLLTAGFATVAVGTLNLISVAFVVLLVGLGLDFAIHLLLHVQEARRRGANTESALRETISSIGPALALCAPTTAVAFFAFIPTDFAGMAQLGLIGGTGVVIAFLVTVTLLPAVLVLLPAAPLRRVPFRHRSVSRAGRARVGGAAALVVLVVAIAALALLPKVRFDADPMVLRDPESRSVRTFNWLFEDANNAPYRMSILVKDGKTAEAVAGALATLLPHASVRTFAGFVPDDQEAKLALIEQASGALASSRAPLVPKKAAEQTSSRRWGLADAPAGSAAAGLMEALAALRQADRLRKRLAEAPAGSDAAGLVEALTALRVGGDRERWLAVQRDVFRNWPQFIDRLGKRLSAESVTAKSLPTPIKEHFLANDGRQRIVIESKQDLRDHSERRRFVELVERVAPDATGSARTTVKAGEVVARSMIQATGLALLSVAILLWATLRSVRSVLLVLLPLALAAILTCAAGVLLDLPFNYANVIVLPLLIGIGVDSAIHLVQRSEKLTRDDTIYATSTPRAVLYSALTTLAAFGSLAFSEHRGTASMGSLLAIAIACTLLATLVVLPAATALVSFGRARR